MARIGKVGGAVWEPMFFFTKTKFLFQTPFLAKTRKWFLGTGYVKDGRSKTGRILGICTGLAGTLPATEKRGRAGRPVLFRPLGRWRGVSHARWGNAAVKWDIGAEEVGGFALLSFCVR